MINWIMVKLSNFISKHGGYTYVDAMGEPEKVNEKHDDR